MKIENENLKTKYSSIKEENKNLKTKCSTLREEHADISDFFDQFKKNFWQGLVVGLVQIIAFAVIAAAIEL